MQAVFQRLVRACQARELPIRQRAFAALVAVTVLVDLSAYALPRSLAWGPRQFHMPWLPIWPALSMTPASVLALHGATLLACIGANALFWGRRWGAWALLLVYGYAFLDHQPAYTNNGYLLLVMLGVLAASDLRSETAAWPRIVGQVTVSAMYLGAGLAKLDPFFLSGSVLDQALHHYGDRYAAWIGFESPTMFALASWSAALLELSLAVGLWVPRVRLFAIAAGIAFHVGI